MTITNSIVANNFRGADGTVADDIRGGVTANYNFIGDETGAEITGSNNLNGDPMLGVLADNGGPTKTHALLANSPAIDAGDSVAGAEAGDFDQRGTGFSRSLGNGIDIGAFESGAESGPEENDAFDRVVFRFMSAKNVTIEKTSNGSTTTETVTNTDPVQRPELLAKEFVFELPNSSDAATLRDVTGTGIMRFGGSTFLDVLFNVTETTRLIVRGNKGNDSIKFASLDTAFHASVTLEGGDGADRLDASLLTLGTQLLGGLGNDTLLGSSGDDTITAGFGSDYIQGKLGTDTLIESGDVNFVLANSFLLGLGTDVING